MAGKPNPYVQKRNQEIRQKYYRLKEKGKRQAASVIEKLAGEYDLSPKSIENIVYGRR